MTGAPRVGFAGLGLMGAPMARRLVAGGPITVWNRTPERRAEVPGAAVAGTIDELVTASDVLLLMLADEAAVDEVLDRGGPGFGTRVRGRTVVHMGTTSPAFSAALGVDVAAAGGRYVEAPVSGSRGPAERGELVVMLAGDPGAVELVAPLLAPVASRVVVCGAPPSALLMKLAVNLYLITTVAGLSEAMHFAAQHGLDPVLVREVLDGGQMASTVSRDKARRIVEGDFTPQAAVRDVLKNSRLVAQAARDAGIDSPLLDVSETLFAETVELGHGELDMAAVVRAVERRSARLGGASP